MKIYIKLYIPKNEFTSFGSSLWLNYSLLYIYEVKQGNIKEAYSNLCMKIHLTSKLTEYLTNNIFKMRFLMRNNIKYAQQCKNGIFEKTCRATTVP